MNTNKCKDKHIKFPYGATIYIGVKENGIIKYKKLGNIEKSLLKRIIKKIINFL